MNSILDVLDTQTKTPFRYKNACFIPGHCGLSAISEAMVSISEEFPAAIMDTNLARNLGFQMIIATPEFLNELKQEFENVYCAKAQKEFTNAEEAGLPKEAIQWLKTGERGTSSSTMFSVGFHFPILKENEFDFPHDPDDFRRCRKLIDAVPQIKSHFHSISKINHTWNEIITRWDELCSLMDSEYPQWNTPNTTGSAPTLYAKLQECRLKPTGPKI